MALERRNPLPPGRYWLDVHGPRSDAEGPQRDRNVHFGIWKSRNSDAVHVEKTQSFPDEDPPRNFVIFRTIKEIPWGPEMADVLGFPTIATDDVQSSDDTVQRPPPEAPDLADQLKTIVLWTAGAVVGVGVLSILYSLLKRKAAGG